MKINLHREVF
jgi:WD40 repeat protein